MDLWDVIAEEAAGESELWADALLPTDERQHAPVFSPLGEERYAVGIETIYEGYLLHYGRSRLFAPPDEDTTLLLGDYLYAHGLVRVASLGNVVAVADLGELISACAQRRAESAGDDGPAWAATAALLGRGGLDEARDAFRVAGDSGALLAVARAAAGAEPVAQALAAHERRLG